MRAGPLLLVAATALALVALAACGGDDDGPDFATGDLAALNFAPDELSGMEHQPDSSGAGAFARDQREEAREEGDRGGLELLRRLRGLGLEEDYVSQFFAARRDSELSFVESIAFLFEDAERAEDAMAEVRDASAENIEPAREIEVPEIGEQTFGLRGEFEGFVTYSLGWRVGDVIQLLGVAPGERDAGPERTLALARQLEAKAEG